MSKAKPWIKLWWDWYATRSHTALTWKGLAVGPPLLLFAAQSEGVEPLTDIEKSAPGDTRWLLTEQGLPVGTKEICTVTRMRPRLVRDGVRELVHAGTIIQAFMEDPRVDESVLVMGFPNFEKYQATPEAIRKRLQRDRDTSVTSHKKVTPLSNQEDRGQRTEDRGKTINNKQHSSKANEYISAVLEMMGKAIKELKPTSTGPRDTPANCKLINRPKKECQASLEDWQKAIDSQLANVRDRPDAWQYLSLSTLSKPANFQRALDSISAPTSSKKPEGMPQEIWEDLNATRH